MSEKIVFLGTGTPILNLEREGPAIALQTENNIYLFDAGRGVVRRLVQANLPWKKISNVFLTHLHSDHTAGLTDFMYTTSVVGRFNPLDIYGPSGTEQMVSHLKQAFSKDVEIRVNGLEEGNPLAYEFTPHEISINSQWPKCFYRDSEISVSAFPVLHGDWECFGYRIETRNNVIVLSGDTAPTSNLIEISRGCDLLIHEVYYALGFSKYENPGNYYPSFHTSGIELGTIAAEVQPRILAFNHQIFCNGTDEDILEEIRQNFTGNIIPARDLDVIELE
ncbi:MAG: MBL fold metallo-hydrolase [Promethearchaeota archaeon]